MVVSGFRRSVSFSTNPNRPSKPQKTYHVRSTSLPCRPHSLFISHLKDQIAGLKTWASKPETRSTAQISNGLARLRSVHESLDDILGLPETQNSLRRHPSFVENLLEAFLRFVDAFGIFQTSILVLKQEISAAGIAVRRNDGAAISLRLKGLKKAAKDMRKLVAAVQATGIRCSSSDMAGDETELSDVIGDVIGLTVSVSVAVFGGISVSISSRRGNFMGMVIKKGKIEEGIEEFVGIDEFLWGLRKKGGDEMKMGLKKMHEVEDCLGETESGSDRVFRSLINTRVSLLNLLTK